MAKITPPSNVRIAALKSKKAEAFDPMSPGGGTPWEDRGSIGIVKAFFATCFMSMKSPRMLFGSIRRVETTGEALRFAIGSGLMWGVGILLSGLIRLAYVASRPDAVVDFPVFAIQYGALTIGMIAAVVVLMWIGARILHSLISAELKHKVPPSLTTNLVAYSLGPSVLAVIPYIGPVLAAIGILVVMVLACTSRLRVNTRGAVTCSIITWGGLALAVLVVWALWWWLGWQTWYEIRLPPKPPMIRLLA
jgi:hypothetical protein